MEIYNWLDHREYIELTIYYSGSDPRYNKISIEDFTNFIFKQIPNFNNYYNRIFFADTKKHKPIFTIKSNKFNKQMDQGDMLNIPTYNVGDIIRFKASASGRIIYIGEIEEVYADKVKVKVKEYKSSYFIRKRLILGKIEKTEKL